MATKRFHDGKSDGDQDGQSSNEKKMKRLSSFGSVIKEFMAANSIQNMLAKIEPVLRWVVREEVQKSLGTSLSNDSKLLHKQIQPIVNTNPSTFNLIFPKKLAWPIFTLKKISDEEGKPLQIIIVETSFNKEETLIQLPSTLKLEIVVLNGDFSVEERKDWTSEDFEKNIVKERVGKRPLLIGDVAVVMKDGCATTVNTIMITDNSSWIRSRHFRIGARVSPGSCRGLRIQEAVTEKFMVKDHRGELCKKSHPPGLNHEVWRLEKISKEGKLHKRLVSNGIKTVQDFLKLWVVNPNLLRQILGHGMSDKAWDVATKHANNCILENKQYIYRNYDITIVLNSICQVVGVVQGELTYSPSSLVGATKTYVDQMVIEAYTQWDTLEMVDDLGLNGNSNLSGIQSSSDHINSSCLSIEDFDVVYYNGDSKAYITDDTCD